MDDETDMPRRADAAVARFRAAVVGQGEDFACCGPSPAVDHVAPAWRTRPAVVAPNVVPNPDGDARFLSDVLHLVQYVRTYAEPGEVHDVALRVIDEAVGRGGRSLSDPPALHQRPERVED